jgi:GPI ethanolamine phosphate transferase 3 subunit O
MSIFHISLVSGQLLYVPWFSVICWATFSVVCFYGTGHNATFPGIQWQAAFVGTDGQFSSNVIPGLMVIASTFSAQIWLGVSLPLLLITPLTLLSFRPSLSPKQDVKVKAANGEMFIFEKSTLTEQSLFMLCAKYILVLAFRVIQIMLLWCLDVKLIIFFFVLSDLCLCHYCIYFKKTSDGLESVCPKTDI